MRIHFQQTAPTLDVRDHHDRDTWHTFTCPEKWCRTEVKMQVDREALIMIGEAYLECPRCFGSMRKQRDSGAPRTALGLRAQPRSK